MPRGVFHPCSIVALVLLALYCCCIGVHTHRDEGTCVYFIVGNVCKRALAFHVVMRGEIFILRVRVAHGLKECLKKKNKKESNQVYICESGLCDS